MAPKGPPRSIQSQMAEPAAGSGLYSVGPLFH